MAAIPRTMHGAPFAGAGTEISELKHLVRETLGVVQMQSREIGALKQTIIDLQREVLVTQRLAVHAMRNREADFNLPKAENELVKARTDVEKRVKDNSYLTSAYKASLEPKEGLVGGIKRAISAYDREIRDLSHRIDALMPRPHMSAAAASWTPGRS